MFFGGFPGFPGAASQEEDSSPEPGDVDNQEFYDIIGVSKEATPEEIKKAYRKKVMKAHPDKGGDPEEFKKLQAAYEVLSNPEKRELYDQYGIDGLRDDGGPGGDPFDIFSQLFGGGRGGGKQGARKMKPMVKEIKVTLEDLYNGTLKHLQYQRHRTCEPCEGKGGKDAKKCTNCKGTGLIEKVVQMAPGFISSSRGPCNECKGEGTVYDKENRCQNCKGEKIIKEDKTIEVPIEQGAPNDHHVSFSGEGDEMPGVMAGDLIVQFVMEPHEKFERKGADLYFHKNISLYEALTGTAFQVDHLDGKKIVLTTGSHEVVSPNTKMEIKGKGMPFYKDAMSHGNLYVIFDVEFPKKKDLKHLEDLKKILPVPRDILTNYDKKTAMELENFDESGVNSAATGGKMRGEDEDEEEGMPHGQRVQCAQQ